MSIEKNVLSGNISMLVLKLLEEKDMYGYQIIEELLLKSENVFQLKTGTLYPLLHGLENNDMVASYDELAGNQRMRRYYRITNKGRNHLLKKQADWEQYSEAVSRVIKGGAGYALA